MDREKKAFFESVQRQEREAKDRFNTIEEHRKRWLLKSMSGGFGRNQKTRPKTVTLVKMSWDKKDER